MVMQNNCFNVSNMTRDKKNQLRTSTLCMLTYWALHERIISMLTPPQPNRAVFQAKAFHKHELHRLKYTKWSLRNSWYKHPHPVRVIRSHRIDKIKNSQCLMTLWSVPCWVLIILTSWLHSLIYNTLQLGVSDMVSEALKFKVFYKQMEE